MSTTKTVLMPWNDTYNVGVAVIDVQHRKLVDLINKLHDAMSERKGREILSQVLSELVSYTVVHFTTEERLMKLKGYPDFGPHKAEHDRFIAKVQKFQKDFESGSLSLGIEVMSFLSDWLRNHILGKDQKYVPFLKDAS